MDGEDTNKYPGLYSGRETADKRIYPGVYSDVEAQDDTDPRTIPPNNPRPEEIDGLADHFPLGDVPD